MTQEEILSEVNKVFAGVFGDPRIAVNATTTAKDVAGWDSLTHTVLIAKTQEHFKVKFALREVMRFQNVGDMCALIAKKLAG
jgi:acyl carrier protein